MENSKGEFFKYAPNAGTILRLPVPYKRRLTRAERKTPDNLRYYPVVENWKKKIAPHQNDKTVRSVLNRDVNKYTIGRWQQTFPDDKIGHYPACYESCDWRLYRVGRPPAFWRYVKHAACHWLVNFNLELAIRAEPARPWRILTSPQHSTVWDGGCELFDLNFLALRVPVEDAWRLAARDRYSWMYGPGEHLPVYYVQDYESD
jgi:hypothetical protein